MRCYIGTPTHGTPRIEWLTGFVLMRDYEMTKPPGEGHWAHSNFQVGPYIPKNRNLLVEKMYERECEALFMFDHDVYAPPETLSLMVEAMEQTGAGVIAGDLILGNDARTTGFWDGEDEGKDGLFNVAERPEVDGVPQALGEVGCVATSTILIHRRVFDKISTHVSAKPTEWSAPFFGPGTWFMHWPIWDSAKNIWRDVGEDFSFSKRARRVGERMVMHYGLGLQHHKVGRMTHEVMTKSEFAAAVAAKVDEGLEAVAKRRS